MMNERELALNQREEAVFIMLQQREAAFDLREQYLEQKEALFQSREAAVWRREKLVAEKEKTPTENQERGDVDLMRAILRDEMIRKMWLLEWAVLNSRISTAQFVIEEMRGDVNTKDSSGRTVLFLAVENGLLAAVKLLLPLSRGDIVDSTGQFAIHSAISKGHTDVVKFLISDSPALARKKDNEGYTAFLLAAVKGNLEILSFLIKEGHSDVGERQMDGWTALHCAAIHDRLDVIKFLVEETHHDVNAKDDLGYTALHAALYWSHMPVAEFLVKEAQADVGIVSLEGISARNMPQWNSIEEFLTQRS